MDSEPHTQIGTVIHTAPEIVTKLSGRPEAGCEGLSGRSQGLTGARQARGKEGQIVVVWG